MAALFLPLLFAGVVHTRACPYHDTSAPTGADTSRAERSSPRAHLAAHGAPAIRAKLNKHLTLANGPVAYPDGTATPCADFTVDELDAVQQTLDACTTSSAAVRSLLPRRDLRTEVARLDPAVQADALSTGREGTRQALLVGKCHAIAMQWVHHTTQASRAMLAKQHSKLPLLPVAGYEDHAPTLRRDTHNASAKVADWMQGAVTCSIGHETLPEKDTGNWTKADLPTWPFEVTYNASGYGPYPFWVAGGGAAGALSGKGAQISTWYSAVQNAERLDHSSCTYGAAGIPDGPCTHLFLNNSYAYLFKQDHEWCCISSWPSEVCHLTRPQRNFMDVMSFDGVIPNYVSENGLYTGPAKKWSMHLTVPSNFFFWYVTDPDNMPLEQGEGPCDMYYTGTTSRQCTGPPKMLFHQYHTKTFQPVTKMDPAVFALPEICTTSALTYCEVEPTLFCTG